MLYNVFSWNTIYLYIHLPYVVHEIYICSCIKKYYSIVLNFFKLIDTNILLDIFYCLCLFFKF